MLDFLLSPRSKVTSTAEEEPRKGLSKDTDFCKFKLETVDETTKSCLAMVWNGVKVKKNDFNKEFILNALITIVGYSKEHLSPTACEDLDAFLPHSSQFRPRHLVNDPSNETNISSEEASTPQCGPVIDLAGGQEITEITDKGINSTVKLAENDTHHEKERKSNICPTHHTSACRNKTCKLEHPQWCQKSNMQGIKPFNKKGCDTRSCEYFHPRYCRSSLRFLICLNNKCKFAHVKGTLRERPTPKDNRKGKRDTDSFGRESGLRTKGPKTTHNIQQSRKHPNHRQPPRRRSPPRASFHPIDPPLHGWYQNSSDNGRYDYKNHLPRQSPRFGPGNEDFRRMASLDQMMEEFVTMFRERLKNLAYH